MTSNYSIINKPDKAISLLLTAERNEITWKSMFLDKDLYLKWLWNRCFDSKSRVLGVFNQYNYCVGYLVMTLNTVYDHNELYIHDLFVLPEERGTKTSEYLYEGVVEATIHTDCVRLCWLSTQIPEHYWKDKMFGFKVKTTQCYSIENDDEARRNYESLFRNRS